ncbi:hypothetical protein N7490_003856 [Penicillium lividum]|nr:hypothetical protein N7490_003856 [Penicillium lividum]
MQYLTVVSNHKRILNKTGIFSKDSFPSPKYHAKARSFKQAHAILIKVIPVPGFPYKQINKVFHFDTSRNSNPHNLVRGGRLCSGI